MGQEEPEFYTAQEVAEMLRLDRTTVLRHLANREIRGEKLGGRWRVPQREIQRLRGETGAADDGR